MKKVIYLTTPGAKAHKEGQRIEIYSSSEEKLASVPVNHIKSVAVTTNVSLSTPLVRWLAAEGVAVLYFGGKGDCVGISGNASFNVQSLINQVNCSQNPEYTLKTAQSIVKHKIYGQRKLLQKYLSNNSDPQVSESVKMLGILSATAPKTKNLDKLRGLEGYAAAEYFKVFGKTLKTPEIKFSARSRQPARDIVNSLLNYGYAVLQKELTVMLAANGLHPGIGFLHNLYRNRPSLSLDMLELFRADIIDRMVVKALNLHELVADDFEQSPDEGTRLKPEAQAKFFRIYETTMQTPTSAGIQTRESAENIITQFTNSVEREQVWDNMPVAA